VDEIEITVFDEIKDYKEKIYFFNFRQWIFAILIAVIVIPTYIILKDKIGEEITSYIVIAIAGSLGFIGFVKIHELEAEKILPYWFRHYFLFAKPIHYISDEEYKFLHEKKKKGKKSKSHQMQKVNKQSAKELKRKQKQEKLLMKAKKKYGITENVEIIRSNKTKDNIEKIDKKDNELIEKLSKLTKEEQEILLKLLGR
jgi:hypothetical protein